MRRILTILLAVGMLLSCSGCVYQSGSIETMLSPPKLTPEQHDIYAALKKVEGDQIRPSAPRSGDRLSAFVVEDLDDEPTPEAFVFFEQKGKEAAAGIQMCVLDMEDNVWQAKQTIPGAGNEVDKVVIVHSQQYNRKFVFVGYNVVNKGEKLLKRYKIENGIFTEMADQNYTALEVTDLDMDGDDEVLLIQAGLYSKETRVQMWQYDDVSGFVMTDEIPMEPNVSNYQIKIGKLYPDIPALYVDGSRGVDLYGTEILYCIDGKLENPLYRGAGDLGNSTIRNVSTPVTDLDGDQIYEIPNVRLFPGHENEEQSSQQYITDWYDFEEGKMIKRCSSYVNTAKGYIFKLPETWGDMISIRQEGDQEIQFFLFHGTIDDYYDTVLQIKVLKLSELRTEGAGEGFTEVKRNGQTIYLARISPDIGSEMALTLDQVGENLILTQ